MVDNNFYRLRSNQALKLRIKYGASSPRGSSPQRKLTSERPRTELHHANSSPPSA
jgi:hypothetical protein